MILHIFNKQEKFSVQYIKFLKESGVNLEGHIVFHYGKSSGTLEKMGVKVLFSSFLSPLKHIQLYKMMKNADKIIIHSLASPFLLLLLMFRFKVSRKFCWVIWGKDLYFTKCVNMNNPFMRMYEFVRKKSLKNIRYIITNVEADFELAKKWYGMDAKLLFMDGMSYPYNSEIYSKEKIQRKERLKYVLLGNSASVSNHHLEAFDILKEQDDGEINIICPLSYGGNRKYVGQVIEKGKKLFGKRFEPLTDFMPLDEYNKLLEKVDIAFFYHDRQEAFSNTLTLLSSGKKVYIRRVSTLWDYFEQKGIVVHDSEKIESEFQMSDEAAVLIKNQMLVEQIRDIKVSLKCWKRIFNENLG